MEEKLKQEPGNIIKIVLFGPESTGKTTLAWQLATYYKTELVPEFMREYLQEKWDKEKEVCQPEDLLHIAVGQMKIENRLAKRAEKLLICDTNLLELKVYSEAYYNEYCNKTIEKFALANSYNLYLLTNVDVPWVADDLRDKPMERTSMFLRFKQTLEKYKMPHIVIEGNREERFNMAIQNIDSLLNEL